MSGRGPQKTCPACDAKVHARKAKCPCGHVFASKKRAASPPRPPLAPLPTSTTGRRRSAGSPASYAEPSLKSKMRQKRGEAVVAAPKASAHFAQPPPEKRRRTDAPPAAPPKKRGRPPKKQPPEDALALLNALEAKESLSKDDVRALAQCTTNDDERACQLLDEACKDDQVALEACATTLTLASERGGAYASAERTN